MPGKHPAMPGEHSAVPGEHPAMPWELDFHPGGSFPTGKSVPRGESSTAVLCWPRGGVIWSECPSKLRVQSFSVSVVQDFSLNPSVWDFHNSILSTGSC